MMLWFRLRCWDERGVVGRLASSPPAEYNSALPSPADYKSALPSVLFEEVVDAFFVVAVEVAGEGGLISYQLALAQG